ncbi:MAG: 6-phosphogluconolactonase, partial [Oscillospiraceae bacterium]|nr:6-phosphogluconolactonase [Oscillospiraceae bacterium]
FSKIEDVPEHALTLTVPALISAKRVFCMVPASTKAVAVREAVFGEIREMLPASVLRMHSNATLYVDKDSGKYILNNFSTQSQKKAMDIKAKA